LEILITLHRSLIKALNNNGPFIDPCEMLDNTSKGDDRAPE
jgi:hypothetical protein